MRSSKMHIFYVHIVFSTCYCFAFCPSFLRLFEDLRCIHFHLAFSFFFLLRSYCFSIVFALALHFTFYLRICVVFIIIWLYQFFLYMCDFFSTKIWDILSDFDTFTYNANEFLKRKKNTAYFYNTVFFKDSNFHFSITCRQREVPVTQSVHNKGENKNTKYGKHAKPMKSSMCGRSIKLTDN